MTAPAFDLAMAYVIVIAGVMGFTYLVVALRSWVVARREEREEREAYDAELNAYHAGDGPPPAPLSTWTWQ